MSSIFRKKIQNCCLVGNLWYFCSGSYHNYLSCDSSWGKRFHKFWFLVLENPSVFFLLGFSCYIDVRLKDARRGNDHCLVSRVSCPFVPCLLVLSPVSFYECDGFSRSLTVFTGLKVSMGTSTNTVIQSAMAPFQRPGSSKALSSRPSFDLLETNPVFGST